MRPLLLWGHLVCPRRWSGDRDICVCVGCVAQRALIVCHHGSWIPLLLLSCQLATFDLCRPMRRSSRVTPPVSHSLKGPGKQWAPLVLDGHEGGVGEACPEEPFQPGTPGGVLMCSGCAGWCLPLCLGVFVVPGSLCYCGPALRLWGAQPGWPLLICEGPWVLV